MWARDGRGAAEGAIVGEDSRAGVAAGDSATGDDVWTSSTTLIFLGGMFGNDIRPRFLPFPTGASSSAVISSIASGSVSTAAIVTRRPFPFLWGTGGGGISMLGEWGITDIWSRGSDSEVVVDGRPRPLTFTGPTGSTSTFALPLDFAEIDPTSTAAVVGAAKISVTSCA